MNAGKEPRPDNMTVAEGLKKIGAAFLFKRDVVYKNASIAVCQNYGSEKSSQELHAFVSTDLPQKSICVTKSQQELEDLDDDSTDIFKSNIVERYGIRPDSISSIDKLCLAEFAANCYKDYKKDSDETNDA